MLILFGLILLLSGFRIGDLSEGLRSTGNWAPILFVMIGVGSMSILIPKTMVSLAAGALLGTAVGCPIMLVTAVLMLVMELVNTAMASFSSGTRTTLENIPSYPPP